MAIIILFQSVFGCRGVRISLNSVFDPEKSRVDGTKREGLLLLHGEAGDILSTPSIKRTNSSSSSFVVATATAFAANNSFFVHPYL